MLTRGSCGCWFLYHWMVWRSPKCKCQGCGEFYCECPEESSTEGDK